MIYDVTSVFVTSNQFVDIRNYRDYFINLFDDFFNHFIKSLFSNTHRVRNDGRFMHAKF